MGPLSHLPVLYHLSVGISENGYPVSDNRTLNCEGVAPSHINWGETAMGYPFQTYTMSISHKKTQTVKRLLDECNNIVIKGNFTY